MKKKKLKKMVRKLESIQLAVADSKEYNKNTRKSLELLGTMLENISPKCQCNVNDGIVDVTPINNDTCVLTANGDAEVIGGCIDSEFNGDRIFILSENRPKSMLIDYSGHTINVIEIDETFQENFRNSLFNSMKHATSDHRQCETYVDSIGTMYDIASGKVQETIDLAAEDLATLPEVNKPSITTSVVQDEPKPEKKENKKKKK